MLILRRFSQNRKMTRYIMMPNVKRNIKALNIFFINIHICREERRARMAEIRDDRTILTRLHGDNFSRGGSWNQEGQGWIAARFGSKPLRGTSRIGRRAISFADCRYRQPLPKYLIPKRLELSMDYKPIYYFPVPTRVSRGGSHEYDTPSPPIEPFGRISKRNLFKADCRLLNSAIGKRNDFIRTTCLVQEKTFNFSYLEHN